MKRLSFGSSQLVAFLLVICTAAVAAQGQTFQPSQDPTQTPQDSKVVTPKFGTASGKTLGQPAKPEGPWKISSRIHLEKESNKGYLVVQVDLADGYHVYSLNPKGSPSPTRLTLQPTKDLNVLSAFMSEKDPLVIEKDPVFGQRVEKHKGVVRFFANIEIRPGIDVKKLNQQIRFSGQVCSDSACQPIRNKSVPVSFGGFFEVPKTRNAAINRPVK